MLHFFRKHQKIFFLFTTIIIVTSFIFFGTYQAIAPAFGGSSDEEESYVGQMTRFLNTEQWMFSRKIFDANFLNDGVISKEFLETGMADLIAKTKADVLEPLYSSRIEKEKQYVPYMHPHLPALSAMSLWSMFSPDLPAKLKAHQEGNGHFKSRSELFLAQKNFPPAFLSQVIRYQEYNQKNFPPDPRLAKEDIALFGYHTLSDWFGEEFITALSEVIIKTAQIARKQGYKVSREEILAELISRSQETYKGLHQKVTLPVQDGQGLYQFYLTQIGIKESTALKIWEDVTLFRRLMHGVGDAALVDPLPLSDFYAFAYENATIELYQMAPLAKLQNNDDLKRLEIYLAAVGSEKKDPFDIPAEYAPLEIIQERAPQLVGCRYMIYFAKTSKKALQAKVSVKETLDWECSEQNWAKLKSQFPDLAQKAGTPFEILERLDEKSRKHVDIFARKQIVEDHPEWINAALTQGEMEEKEIFLTSKSPSPFEGIVDVNQFISALETQDEMVGYTQDNTHFYRFLIQKRGEKEEILSYQEAVKLGLLDQLSDSLNGNRLVQSVVDASPEKHKTQAYAYRFAVFLKDNREAPALGKLAGQFKIEKQQKTVTRSENSFISVDEAIALVPGALSPVKVDPKEGAYLYRFIEKKTDRSLPLEKIRKSQELLSKEVRCRYFEELLPRLLT